jgi:hypothetical protein
VIVGEEIMTTRGEILAAFVRGKILACLRLKRFSGWKDQGALISVASV